jgi:regulatory protein
MSPTHEELKQKLESFCAYQDRCLLEVRSKLSVWGVPMESHNELIEYLQSSGYLNELRFAESYVSGKFRMKKWGRRKINAGLRSKGVSSEFIHLALGEIDPEVYWETLLFIASRKSNELKLSQDFSWEKKSRLVRFLMQRGYEGDLVSDAVEKILRK